MLKSSTGKAVVRCTAKWREQHHVGVCWQAGEPAVFRKSEAEAIAALSFQRQYRLHGEVHEWVGVDPEDHHSCHRAGQHDGEGRRHHHVRGGT